jgi:hypothetical protein
MVLEWISNKFPKAIVPVYFYGDRVYLICFLAY